LGPLCVHDRSTHVFNTMFVMVHIMCTAQVHIMDQPELGRGEGPIAVVVAPTRELAEQIHKETRKFSRVYSKWWWP
jgi:superfamily II DNA/RNA helicase